MSSSLTVPPPISWAQRNHLLYVIINVECKDVEHKFTEDSMYFKGTGVVDNKDYEVTLNFLNKINSEKVSSKNISRCLEFTIDKKESGPYWSTLTADKKKPHFLKVDFNKWVDETSDNEDESEFLNDSSAPNAKALEQIMNMQLPKEKPDIGEADDDETDSDDELPDLY